MVSHKPGTNLRSFFPMSQKKPSSKTEKQLLVFSEKEKRSSKKEREKIAQTTKQQNNKIVKPFLEKSHVKCHRSRTWSRRTDSPAVCAEGNDDAPRKLG
jgi:hypothetical protein